jgi:hypothetical protein
MCVPDATPGPHRFIAPLAGSLLAGAILLLGVPGLTGTPGAGFVHAQVQHVEKEARVEVSVFEDNLDDAKSRAIAQGQAAALRSLIEDLVAPEWVTLFDKELRRRVLNRVDRYVASYRVQKLETSPDRTRYLAVLSAQISRAQLTQDLHELSLPVRGDPPTTVTLLYDPADPVLGQPAQRAQVEARLRARLSLLNFRVGALAALEPPVATALANPSNAASERVRMLARAPTSTALLLAFEPAPAPGADQVPDVGAKASAWLYQKSNGALLATFEQQERSEPLRLPTRTPREQEQLLARLVEPLVIQMQPAAIASLRTAGDGDAELRLRVLGFRSVEEQTLFEREFFQRNTPFERFSLHALAPDAVTYRGPFGGDRASLEADLRGERIGDFRVRQVYWFNDVLELDVERQATPPPQELRMFPREVRSPDVAALLDDYLARFSSAEVEDPLYIEVEDNGWLNRADRLPFNATVYGFLDSRSDSDVFVGEALSPGETVTLIWHRVGRTNLTPALRLYDESGTLVHTFTPRSWLRFEYTVPKGQHRFYLEVGDRFGHLKVDTGGYLHAHYLFKVRRSGS